MRLHEFALTAMLFAGCADAGRQDYLAGNIVPFPKKHFSDEISFHAGCCRQVFAYDVTLDGFNTTTYVGVFNGETGNLIEGLFVKGYPTELRYDPAAQRTPYINFDTDFDGEADERWDFPACIENVSGSRI